MSKLLLPLLLIGLSGQAFAAFELRLPLCGNCPDDWTVPDVSVWAPSTSSPTLMVAADGTLTVANAGVGVKGISFEGDVSGFAAALTAQGGHGGVWTVTNAGVTVVPSGAITLNTDADGAATDYTRLVLTQVNTDGALFQDCGGNDLNVWFDGIYPTPDGWTDPSSAPVDPTYVPGYFWTPQNYSSSSSASNSTPFLSYQSVSEFSTWSGTMVRLETYGAGDPRNTYNYNRTVWPWAQQIQSNSCSGYEAVHTFCDPGFSAPMATEWPTDGRYDLSLSAGGFHTNNFDSEAPSQGSFPSINYTSASGSGNITALVDSVWKHQSSSTVSCGGGQSQPMIKFGASNQKEIIF